MEELHRLRLRANRLRVRKLRRWHRQNSRRRAKIKHHHSEKRRPSTENFQHRYLNLPNFNDHDQKNSFNALSEHSNNSPRGILMVGSNQVDRWRTNNARRRQAASSKQGIFPLAPVQMGFAWFASMLGLASISRGILSSVITNGIEQQLINGNLYE